MDKPSLRGNCHCMREPGVVIAGCGVVSAMGCGVEPLRNGLLNNLSGLRPSKKFDSPRFQSNITGTALPDDQGDSDDPAWLLATEALNQARDAAQTILAKIPAERMGLVLSTTKANIVALERLTDGRACSAAAQKHLRADRLASDLAATHDARGPVQTVSVACVSGLVAIQQGTRMIQRGETDAALVVGVDCLSEFVVAGFTALKALDPSGCRPFDAARCGLSPGEAGAAIILARADLVSQPAVRIRGFGGSNDANHLTGPSRDGSGLAQAIHTALKAAGLTPHDIDYVHAHGTGTSYNDAMESLALRAVFGEAGLPVSGSKGMLGHTLGAAGVIETIICALAMLGSFLPGTPRLNAAAEGTPASLLPIPRTGVRLKHVLKLNTGFGGMNGALILAHE
jgi:3-oxoacyl-(acyl-carrier-protein) synthase